MSPSAFGQASSTSVRGPRSNAGTPRSQAAISERSSTTPTLRPPQRCAWVVPLPGADRAGQIPKQRRLALLRRGYDQRMLHGPRDRIQQLGQQSRRAAGSGPRDPNIEARDVPQMANMSALEHRAARQADPMAAGDGYVSAPQLLLNRVQRMVRHALQQRPAVFAGRAVGFGAVRHGFPLWTNECRAASVADLKRSSFPDANLLELQQQRLRQLFQPPPQTGGEQFQQRQRQSSSPSPA